MFDGFRTNYIVELAVYFYRFIQVLLMPADLVVQFGWALKKVYSPEWVKLASLVQTDQ